MNNPSSIFLVEDEALIAMELRDQLEEMGYHVCGHAARGETALEEIPKQHPDLTLMDINLGGRMDGIETAGRLEAHGEMPVVFLSAYADPALIRRAVKAGPFGYLTKPYNPRELDAAIQVAIRRSQKEKELRQRHEECEQRCAKLQRHQGHRE